MDSCTHILQAKLPNQYLSVDASFLPPTQGQISPVPFLSYLAKHSSLTGFTFYHIFFILQHCNLTNGFLDLFKTNIDTLPTFYDRRSALTTLRGPDHKPFCTFVLVEGKSELYAFSHNLPIFDAL